MSKSPPTIPAPVSGLFDRPLPVMVRVILLLICMLIPTAYVVGQYLMRHDLTQLILFGQMWQERALPEIRELKPAINSPAGFDGQFYAQIALDPTLRRPDLPRTMDDPSVRTQRIVLPALAHVLGFGSPAATLRAYALLNLAFWYLLFAALVYRLRAATIRSFLIIFAIMLTTGALISIQRSLTDLPAATFGFLSLGLGEMPAALLISISILTKPTSGLFLTRYLFPFPRTPVEWGKKLGAVLLALVPPTLWLLYTYHMLGAKLTDGDNLNFPFYEWSHRVAASWQTLADTPIYFQPFAITQWEWNLFEFLALMSMTFQGAFLLLRPRWHHPIWLMGIGFAILFFCLTHKTYVEQISYTRTVLPLTIAFNLLLLESKRGPLFFLYFIAGNIGLILTLHNMIGFLLG